MALRLAQAAEAAPGSDPVPPPGAAGSGGTGKGSDSAPGGSPSHRPAARTHRRRTTNYHNMAAAATVIVAAAPALHHGTAADRSLPRGGGKQRPSLVGWPQPGRLARWGASWLFAHAPSGLLSAAQAGRAALECACAAVGHVPPRGVGNAQARGGGQCHDGEMEAGPGRAGAPLASDPLLRWGRPVELFPSGSATCPGVLPGSPGRQGLASLHGSRPAGLEAAAAVPLPDRGTAGSGSGRKRRNLPALPRVPGRI